MDTVEGDTVKASSPYPNEHSCLLRDPETLDIVGSGERKHNGKTYHVVYDKPKDKPEADSVEQAYRYPAKTWSETEARRHCQDHGGSFAPAAHEVNAIVFAPDKNVPSFNTLWIHVRARFTITTLAWGQLNFPP